MADVQAVEIWIDNVLVESNKWFRQRAALWKKMATIYRKAYHNQPDFMPTIPRPGVRRIARAEHERDVLRQENERLVSLMTNAGICLQCGSERLPQARDGCYCPECEPEKDPRLHTERDPNLVPRWPWSALE